MIDNTHGSEQWNVCTTKAHCTVELNVIITYINFFRCTARFIPRISRLYAGVKLQLRGRKRTLDKQKLCMVFLILNSISSCSTEKAKPFSLIMNIHILFFYMHSSKMSQYRNLGPWGFVSRASFPLDRDYPILDALSYKELIS